MLFMLRLKITHPDAPNQSGFIGELQKIKSSIRDPPFPPLGNANRLFQFGNTSNAELVLWKSLNRLKHYIARLYQL
jgi:hypothetical protein